MSGLASGLFLLRVRCRSSSSRIQRRRRFSIQRSGIVNGFTQVIALAGDASAVAVAPMFAVAMPKYCAMSVETGLPRLASR